MSAKDQIKQLVDYFKRERYLKDKTDAMGDGLMLGASLADEANERSKEATTTTKAIQDKYKEQILAQDLNQNKDPELVDLRGGNATAGERIDKFENVTNQQLKKTDTMLFKPKSVWDEFENQYVNVKWMGAKSDGITDDSLAIQKAIDTGLNVYIPVGLYLVKNLIVSKSGQIIRGGGKVRSWGGNHAYNETVLKGIGGSSDYILINSIEKEDDVVSATRFEDLVIDGNEKSTNGIRLGNSSVVNEVRFQKCIDGITNALVSSVLNCQFFDNLNGMMRLVDSRISNSFFVRNGTALNMSDSNDNIISNNKIEWNGRGIYLKDAVFNLITGNILDRQTTYGIQTETSAYNTIVSNQFERNLLNHMYLNGSHFLVHGNTYYKKNSEDDMSGLLVPNEAIFLKSVSSSNISGNHCFGKMYNTTGSDYVIGVQWSDNTVDSFHPEKLEVSIPETPVQGSESKTIKLSYPTEFREGIKNPWNVRLISSTIRAVSQNGSFYAQGGMIDSIFFNQTTIDVQVTNKTAGTLVVTGRLIVACTLRTLV